MMMKTENKTEKIINTLDNLIDKTFNVRSDDGYRLNVFVTKLVSVSITWRQCCKEEDKTCELIDDGIVTIRLDFSHDYDIIMILNKFKSKNDCRLDGHEYLDKIILKSKVDIDGVTYFNESLRNLLDL